MTHPRAIIFDCDGTLADTMPLHYQAWAATVRRFDLELSEDRFYVLGGWPTRTMIELLASETGRELDVEKISAFKENAFLDLLDHVRPIEPVVEVARAHRGKMPLGVATGATRQVLRRILKQIGLCDFFDAEVTSEDTTLHKPHPDVFLEAARRLGVDPRECRIYEDVDPGIEAARRAGALDVIDVRTFHTPRRITPRDIQATG